MAKTPIAEWKDGKKHFSFWWATAGGIGLLKPAPGTWGSLLGLLLAWPYLAYALPLWLFVSAILVVSIISFRLIDEIEAKSGIHDAPEIVIDEVVGQWITLLPCFFLGYSSFSFLVGFVLFRIMDIWKPWPIGSVDKHTKGGFGVMADDSIAGLIAAIGLAVIMVYI